MNYVPSNLGDVTHNFLSLGAGVQSSALALMAARGELGVVPDAAIFADTECEPQSVYDWLKWLTAEIGRSAYPFPVHIVRQGNLEEQALKMRVTADGRKFSSSDVPVFVRSLHGVVGKVPQRGCTRDFKITPIRRAVRRLAAVKRGETAAVVCQWIGISLDELQRAKVSREKWCVHRWPLIEKRMSRYDCLAWMEANGYPVPPRSSCVFCPFHSNSEWRRLRDEEPQEFQRAVEFELKLQAAKGGTAMRSVPFLHRSGVHLSRVDFSTDEERGQGYFDFQAECEGMCGV